MATPGTPGTADFSSAGPTTVKKTKVVFLGEQSVGKTSLITKCVVKASLAREAKRSIDSCTTHLTIRIKRPSVSTF